MTQSVCISHLILQPDSPDVHGTDPQHVQTRSNDYVVEELGFYGVDKRTAVKHSANPRKANLNSDGNQTNKLWSQEIQLIQK